MDIEELKRTIETRTGVPASLLTAETQEEILAQARAVLNIKPNQTAKTEQSTREQFAEWFGLQMGGADPLQKDSATALEEIENQFRSYPDLKDGGEPIAPPTKPSTKELFKEWITDVLG